MELVPRITPERRDLVGSLNKTISAGEQLKAEVGEEELSEVCPAGKKWSVRLNLEVRETDA